jgi:hypothetical protein
VTEKEKITVRQFKDGSNNWWVSGKHYNIQENTPTLVAGGIEVEEETEHFRKYLKRKKLI